MSLRKDWERAKKSVQPPIPKDFFGKGGLGPLLDKAEKAEDAYDDMPGTKDAATIKKAKRKAHDAYEAAYKVARSYLTLAVMGEKANKNDPKLHKAFDEITTFLSMTLIFMIDKKMKHLKTS